MYPSEHTQLALQALVTHSEQDPRVKTQDMAWLGQWIHEYHQQRGAGVGHDMAIATVLKAIASSLGGDTPVPLTIPAPPLPTQPVNVLRGTADAPTERIEVMQHGQPTLVDRRWTWKSVYHPLAMQWWAEDDPMFIRLIQWIASVGGNALTLVGKVKDDQALGRLTEICMLANLRVYQDPRPPVTPDSTVQAFYLATESLLLYGGGSLALLKTEGDTQSYPQEYAEWWMRGLSMESAEVKDWQTVPVTTLLDYKAGRDGERAMARVNGQQAVVVNVDPSLDWVIQPVKGWRVTEVGGPGHGWVRLTQ